VKNLLGFREKRLEICLGSEKVKEIDADKNQLTGVVNEPI